MGRIFDDRGNRLSPTHARRRGVKYRYYLSSAILNGQAERAGAIRQVPAVEIETLIIRSVREHLKLNDPVENRQLIDTYVVKVEVKPELLVIYLAQTEQHKRAADKGILPRPVAEAPVEAAPRDSSNWPCPATECSSLTFRIPRDIGRIDRPWSALA